MYLLTTSAASDVLSVGLMARHSNKMTASESDPRRWRADHPGRPLRRILGKVESVESIGLLPTFDVEVENSHWYYAGAVKSHNTISKLWGLSEGAHLPAMFRYIRWVQFRYDDPLVADYKAKGYPVRPLTTYEGTVIVGFPTLPEITKVMDESKIVTADMASIEDQYKWIELLTRFWLRGVEVHETGGEVVIRDNPVDRGNQVSYTLKFDPGTVSLSDFKELVKRNQSKVKACALMPFTGSTAAYEYLPEETVSKAAYEAVAREISERLAEDVGKEHVECAGGACPIDFNRGAK